MTGTAGALPTPPEELSHPAQVIWDGILPDLIAAGCFRDSDGFMLVELVETWAEAKAYRRQRVALGDPGSAEDKRLRIGYENGMALVLKISSEFGISPVARLRLGLGTLKAATLLSALDDD